MSKLEQRFLAAMMVAYQKYVDYGPRSNEKLKVVHGWLRDEISKRLGDEYELIGYSAAGQRGVEKKVEGMYYAKNVDLHIERSGTDLGVVSVRFVNSNYKQNINNYFEQQLGETANIRSNNIVYGNMFLLTHPIPYYKRDRKKVEWLEKISDDMITRYVKLLRDHQHPHSPDVQAVALVNVDYKKRQVTGLPSRSDLQQLSDLSWKRLQNELSIRRFIDLLCSKMEVKYKEL